MPWEWVKRRNELKSSQSSFLSRFQPSLLPLCCFRHPINIFRPSGVITNIYITRPITNKMKETQILQIFHRDRDEGSPTDLAFLALIPEAVHLQQLDGFCLTHSAVFIFEWTKDKSESEWKNKNRKNGIYRVWFDMEGFNQRISVNIRWQQCARVNWGTQVL